MAKNIYTSDGYIRKTGTAAAAIAAGDMIKRSSTKWTPCTDSDTAGCDGIAVTAASGDGVSFVYTDPNGLEVIMTGTVAAGSNCYAAGAQAVDGGTTGDVRVGISNGAYPDDATKCRVVMQFTGAKVTK